MNQRKNFVMERKQSSLVTLNHREMMKSEAMLLSISKIKLAKPWQGRQIQQNRKMDKKKVILTFKDNLKSSYLSSHPPKSVRMPNKDQNVKIKVIFKVLVYSVDIQRITCKAV